MHYKFNVDDLFNQLITGHTKANTPDRLTYYAIFELCFSKLLIVYIHTIDNTNMTREDLDYRQ